MHDEAYPKRILKVTICFIAMCCLSISVYSLYCQIYKELWDFRVFGRMGQMRWSDEEFQAALQDGIFYEFKLQPTGILNRTVEWEWLVGWWALKGKCMFILRPRRANLPYTSAPAQIKGGWSLTARCHSRGSCSRVCLDFMIGAFSFQWLPNKIIPLVRGYLWVGMLGVLFIISADCSTQNAS